MNREERIMKIRELVKNAGSGIKSRKKMHKLIYLLQEINEEFDQDYIFHNYGVFSPTLAEDLDFAVEQDFLIQREKRRNDYQFYIYALGKNKIDDLNVDNEIKNKEVLNKLINKKARLLEVLSTIVYLNRNHYSNEKLKEKLKYLKPNLSDYYEESFSLARELYNID
jgi:uncharacterized protein YwgA